MPAVAGPVWRAGLLLPLPELCHEPLHPYRWHHLQGNSRPTCLLFHSVIGLCSRTFFILVTISNICLTEREFYSPSSNHSACLILCSLSLFIRPSLRQVLGTLFFLLASVLYKPPPESPQSSCESTDHGAGDSGGETGDLSIKDLPPKIITNVHARL